MSITTHEVVIGGYQRAGTSKNQTVIEISPLLVFYPNVSLKLVSTKIFFVFKRYNITEL
jgi:hypothetical protein